jgi:plastocyanin
MKRRDFLRTASGVSGAAAAVGAASAGAAADGTPRSIDPNNTTTTAAPDGNETANETTAEDGAGGGGPTEEVIVGPGGDLVYEPDDLTIANGTTVNFVWESDNHNIVVDSQPDDANWEGTPGSDSTTYDTGYEYSHTFTVNGEYEYFCQPHVGAGMVAAITVQDSVSGGGGGGGAKEQDPEHMGVPFQAHFVGIATILAIISSLIYTFYSLKYGESAHTAAPNKK